MASRKSTPDIMGDLMGSPSIKDEKHKTINTGLSKNLKPQSNKTIANSNSNLLTPSQHSRIDTEQTSQDQIDHMSEIDESKEKITMMLSSKLLSELEDKWIELRKLLGSKQVSKSLIIQKSLELALIEFEKTKENSVFFSMITQSIALKK